MTEQDVTRMLALMAARYPNAKVWAEDERVTVRAWHMTLADIPADVAREAMTSWFQRKKWPPDPSELRAEVFALASLAPDENEAWREVRRAIAGYYPGQGGKHPVIEPIAKAIAAIGGLHALALSEEPAKDRDRFLRAYAIECNRLLGSMFPDALASGDGLPEIGS